MLEFSIKQWQLFDTNALAGFHRRLADFVRTEIREATAFLGDEELAQFIGEQDHEARLLGIESEAGVTQFVCLALAFGPGFHKLADAQSYFALPNISPEEKLDELVNYLYSIEFDGNTNVFDSLLGPDL